MEIKKNKDETNYTEMEFEQNGVVFRVFYGGNGDLYWNIIDKNNQETDKVYFSITKENYEVFETFKELYRRIEECDIFEVNQLEEEFCIDEEERQELYQRTARLNESLKEDDAYENLCTDECLIWYSDNAPYGQGNCLKIYQSHTRDSFLIEITKLDKEKDDFSVEISNSGSRYTPFNMAFMAHYTDLCNIDPEYHQIHIEEIMYQKRLTKRIQESSK